MFFPSIEAKWDGVLWVLSLIRRNLITIFSSTLPSASSSLLLGIVFGVRETMPKMLSEELRISGVTHITAASGMNVTMTAGALFTLLSRFLRRQYALLLGLLCVWLYAVLTGLDVSIVRASIMASLAFGAGLFGRQNTTFFALLATGMFMLFINPSILTDIGFQLSFFSTAGIVLLGPYLGLSSWQSEQVFLNSQKKEKVTHLFWQDVGMTIAAQIATLPLLLLHFSQYNFLSIVANGLILWVIPILMTLGLLGAILGLIILPAGQLIIFLSMPFLAYLRWIVGIFGQKDYIVYAPNLSWQVAVGYYLLLVAMVLFLRRRGKLGQSS
jgi:competence protein ComEC